MNNSISSSGQDTLVERETWVRIPLWSLNHFQGYSLISCTIHLNYNEKYFVGVVDLIIRILIGQEYEYLRLYSSLVR